jgi:hypothetical protein
MAITDRTTEDVVNSRTRKETSLPDFFTEEVAAFADPDFWGVLQHD